MENDCIHIIKLNFSKAGSQDFKALEFEGAETKLIIGYISPDVEPAAVATALRSHFSYDVKIVLTTTAGELCTVSGSKPEVSLYQDASDGRSQVVLQSFSSQMLEEAEIHTVLFPDDEPVKKEKVKKIAATISALPVSFNINYHNCIAYTLIDGLSSSENFYMEALYQSGKFPCLTIGGSAGGFLDFQNTYIYNNNTTVQNCAVTVLMRLKENIRYGVFKSQNFEQTQTSFTVGEANENERWVQSVVDKETLEIRDFISELCRHFDCSEPELSTMLESCSFAVTIDDEIYVRSVSGIDLSSRKIHFYCDISFGDELWLVRNTDFITATERDYKHFEKTKSGQVIGAIFNDCILRRLFNGSSLRQLTAFNQIPVAGFSTFGELLGVNINQTLTALFFYKVKPGESFYDDYVDNFVNRYSGFKEYFLRRTIKQQEQIVRLRDIIGQKSRDGIHSLYSLIQELMEYVDINVKTLSTSRGSCNLLYSNIDGNKNEGSVIADELEKLSLHTSDIKEILISVSDIAERINLLGFNASIEAARAGVHGKGFAVVAGEVKKLAKMTQQSVQDSNSSVSSVINRMDEIKEGMINIVGNHDEAFHQSRELVDDIQLIFSKAEEAEGKLSRHFSDIKSLISEINVMDKTEDCLKKYIE